VIQIWNFLLIAARSACFTQLYHARTCSATGVPHHLPKPHFSESLSEKKILIFAFRQVSGGWSGRADGLKKHTIGTVLLKKITVDYDLCQIPSQKKKDFSGFCGIKSLQSFV
jgi:hypothetical protein